MSLANKVVFITGGSRGIGLEIGKRAARDGAKVVLAAKTAEPHPKLPGTIFTAAEEIIEAGGEALPLILDVRDEENVLKAVEETVSHFGGIDICVNNASAISLTKTPDTDMKRYDLMHQINGRGTYLVRKPEIMADAAYEIFIKDSKEFTGNFCIDDLVLHESGVKDFTNYADVSFDKLAPDFFVPDDTPLPEEIKNS